MRSYLPSRVHMQEPGYPCPLPPPHRSRQKVAHACRRRWDTRTGLLNLAGKTLVGTHTSAQVCRRPTAGLASAAETASWLQRSEASGTRMRERSSSSCSARQHRCRADSTLLGHCGALWSLGWLPYVFEVQRLQFGLFGRLATADAFAARRSLAARGFNFALQRPGSWVCWYTAPPFVEPGAWRGCKAGSALESTCRATGVAAPCSVTISWGMDGNAVPRRLCRVSASFARWQQHSFLAAPVVLASGVDVSALWSSYVSGWQKCPARSSASRVPLRYSL